MSDKKLVETTKTYYDSTDADEFYHTIWGGEDIHVGIYELADESIFQASKRSIQTMVSHLPPITEDTRILDLGAGYGGAARYLAARFLCQVECLNLSETENARNREKNKAVRLEDHITVTAGNFEELPYEDDSFDIVWSEEAFLHSGNKDKVFEQARRVLKPGGRLIFTDPMQAEDCPESVLQPILDRIHLEELGSVERYRELAAKHGFSEKEVVEMPEQLVNHYSAVLNELKRKEHTLSKVVSRDYIERMKKGLQHWIDGGKKGYLNWGILHFEA